MARASAGSTDKSKSVYIKLGILGHFGLKKLANNETINTGGIKYPPFYEGNVSTNNAGYPNALDCGFIPPTAIDSFILKGWNQAKVLIAAATSTYMLQDLLYENTKDIYKDQDAVSSVVLKLMLINALHYVEKGARIEIPESVYYGGDKQYNFPAFNIDYDKAVNLCGMDIVKVTVDQLIVQFPQSGDPYVPGCPIHSSLIDANRYYLNNNQIWQIDDNSIVVSWEDFNSLGRALYDEAYKYPEWHFMPAPPTLFKIKSTGNDLNLREKASSSSKSITKMPVGQILYQLSAPIDGWIFVCHPTLGYGYVSDKYVEAVYKSDSASAGTTTSSGTSTVSFDTTDKTTGKKPSGGSDSLDMETTLPPYPDKTPLPKDEPEESFFTPTKIAIAVAGTLAVAGGAAYLLRNKKVV